MIGEVRTVDNVPQAFAAFVEEAAPTSIALSGGETARECYELLAVAGVEWQGVDVWFGDERWVPVHDPDSNEGMARVVLLDEVEPRSIEPMYQPDLTPEAGAERYDGLLRAAPPLGLVHLGLGPDGHTCSLFPGSASLDERERFVVTAGDDQHPHPRLDDHVPRARALGAGGLHGRRRGRSATRSPSSSPATRCSRRVGSARSVWCGSWTEPRTPRPSLASMAPAPDFAALEHAPLDELVAEAGRLRDAGHGDRITFSPKVFVPLTMLCRDRCGYCTFAKPPARLESPYLSLDEVLRIARARRGTCLPRGAVHPR